ncbi:D-alanyl-D-alanine carboxypeptidase [Bacillus pseudomycoides]|uniref:D-alanyl-D-alanine carboxypeptidase n=1 Tax=Bacillus pseudomycoides TaxID=64104 RepID=A0AA91ZRV3_9BACI|nr:MULTISPECIES: M15 family metallopeptidase [Bacillus]PEB50263.1 D-alanyl-D-alanine carboxypeptidase [Bacillus sp. AFS098217]PED80787.1 D-alanyl-D-alanine carboxypeptidase [Bacillus pseudomycoides]PEU08785.1 D-alanyl-D-alanine carboxypeptidase [Bacillus sp. AFS014408]PEU09686.1 D-alanyl-D-alanine carboxypeptidase [Bacillus sp. AFS019443]PFW56712.1 D-alanyl-D-alanine carboxypeptidase [Bacillus sp. AFS075034]
MKKRWALLSVVVVVIVVAGMNYKMYKDKQAQEVNASVAFPKEQETITKMEGDIAVVNNPDSILVLVNKNRRLPDRYKPQDLVIPKVRYSNEGDQEKKKMRKEAAVALEKMFQQGDQERIFLFAVSGFRSFDRQKALNTMYKIQDGEAKTAMSSAVPGTSEHQTGLAMDITSQSAKFQLESIFGDTKEGKWLAQNAHKFGFVIRYTKEKESITGYRYEPWHVRYVGNPQATYLYENQLTLEEAMK